jgi:glycosyltransferase involved in cell wall biosynthesis
VCHRLLMVGGVSEMLSIVIIGRNEAEHLERLGHSVSALKSSCDFPVESIYVDSASSDSSVEIARRQFDRVEALVYSEHLCASAGRYVGTYEAKYPWIFYLDGDMEVCPDFFSVIRNLGSVDSDVTGIIGIYTHYLDNGRSAVQTFRRPIGAVSRAMHFGGAVVLRRDAVLKAGNWDPALYGREEIELYARLGSGKQVVNFVDVPMVNHYSEYYPRRELVRRLLSSSGGQGKVFWGYGQCVRAAIAKGKFSALMLLEYELYAFWLGFFFALLIGIFISPLWFILVQAFIVACLSLWARPGSIVRYLLQPISLASGWWRYLPWFRPVLRKWNPDGNPTA